jgi:hypothetical protein
MVGRWSLRRHENSLVSMRVHLHFSLKTWPWLPTLGIMLGAAAPKSSYVTCPECGTMRVKKLLKPDPVDRISAAPWSRIQGYLGGRRYHCLFCRLQFFDCRKQALLSTVIAGKHFN